MKTNQQRIQTITGIGLLSAIVFALQFVSMAIRFGTFSITLSLIPMVVGAAMYGAGAGAWLGFVFGLAVLISGDASPFLAVNIAGTVITVLAKGMLSGFVSGLVYRLLEKKNGILAAVCAAILSPVVNTGVFLIGCVLFFWDTISTWAMALPQFGENVVAYMFVGLVGLNFIWELGVNLVFSQTLVNIIRIGKKRFSRQ